MATQLTPDELEDLITSAQDAYFDGNLESVIEICQRIVKAAPRESDAYELLTLSLFQSKPPRYQEAIEFAIQWGKQIQTGRRRESDSTSNSRTKQLMMLIKCAYHTGNAQIIADTARQLQQIQNVDISIHKALAAALASEYEEALPVAMEISLSFDQLQKISLLDGAEGGGEEEDETLTIEETLNNILQSDPEIDNAERLRIQTLLTWVKLQSKDEAIRKESLKHLHHLIDTGARGNTIPQPNDNANNNEETDLANYAMLQKVALGFTFALLALYYLESGQMDEIEKLIQRADSIEGVREEDNLQAVRVLWTHSSSNNHNQELQARVTRLAFGVNDIIKKRLEKKILYC